MEDKEKAMLALAGIGAVGVAAYLLSRKEEGEPLAAITEIHIY